MHNAQYRSFYFILQVSRKEQEVQAYKEELQVVQRQQYHQDQIQDRLRHYEAQAQLVETLQNELTSAQVSQLISAIGKQVQKKKNCLAYGMCVCEGIEASVSLRLLLFSLCNFLTRNLKGRAKR